MSLSSTPVPITYIKGDYLISALESELLVLPTDSPHLTYLKETLREKIKEYMSFSEEPCTPRDSQKMEEIDQAVWAIRNQRMAESIP